MHAGGDFLQHAQIEIDDVPARQDVRVEGADAFAKHPQRRKLIDTARGTFRHGALAAIDDEHLVDARREQEIASKRSPLASVSISKDSTRGSTITSADRTVGLSKIQAIPPVPATASPSIWQPPLMPRSIR